MERDAGEWARGRGVGGGIGGIGKGMDGKNAKRTKKHTKRKKKAVKFAYVGILLYLCSRFCVRAHALAREIQIGEMKTEKVERGRETES